MSPELVDWLLAAFTFTNGIRAVFYIPQIIAVARSTDGAKDIALSTWAMWALNNGLGALYVQFGPQQMLLAVSLWTSTFCCCLTMGLTISKRRRLARLALPAASVPDGTDPRIPREAQAIGSR